MVVCAGMGSANLRETMSTPNLNFERAVSEGESASPDQCAYCGRGITGEYYRVGGHLACPVCAQQAQSLMPLAAHKTFMHSLSYGAAAAVLGCLGYALIAILTGWTIGYAAMGVGYMIGWAMRRAARGHGGRRYQIAAALLAYAAVSIATIPIIWHADLKDGRITSQQVSTATNGTQGQTSVNSSGAERQSVGGFLVAVVELFGLGLFSPFAELAGPSLGGGLLDLFIIFIGMRFAWQMMAVKTVSVEGPFESLPTVP
jgi:hypothetical protein